MVSATKSFIKDKMTGRVYILCKNYFKKIAKKLKKSQERKNDDFSKFIWKSFWKNALTIIVYFLDLFPLFILFICDSFHKIPFHIFLVAYLSLKIIIQINGRCFIAQPWKISITSKCHLLKWIRHRNSYLRQLFHSIKSSSGSKDKILHP